MTDTLPYVRGRVDWYLSEGSFFLVTKWFNKCFVSLFGGRFVHNQELCATVSGIVSLVLLY